MTTTSVTTNMKTNRTSKKTRGNGQGTRNLCFSLSCGDVQTVYLAGSFNDWNSQATPLRRHRDGRWACELALPPGRHEYQFVVDGRWMPDPQAPEAACNPFGTVNSIVRVPAEDTCQPS